MKVWDIQCVPPNLVATLLDPDWWIDRGSGSIYLVVRNGKLCDSFNLRHHSVMMDLLEPEKSAWDKVQDLVGGAEIGIERGLDHISKGALMEIRDIAKKEAGE